MRHPEALRVEGLLRVGRDCRDSLPDDPLVPGALGERLVSLRVEERSADGAVLVEGAG
jgi:hypothetical protein